MALPILVRMTMKFKPKTNSSEVKIMMIKIFEKIILPSGAADPDSSLWKPSLRYQIEISNGDEVGSKNKI